MITKQKLLEMKKSGEKITMLTCYDASFAKLMDQCGIDLLLVGDSLGMVIKGDASTLSVTLEDIIYHTKAVSKGNHNALIVSDLPFGSYEKNKEEAFISASKVLASGAHMIKIEGGIYMQETVAFLQERGIPVCGHIGLTPQAVNMLSGYKVQGRGQEAEHLFNEAKSLDKAGVSCLVMECIPTELAKKITENISCPTIGIGAGVHCDGQVLVMQDMLGIYQGKTGKFVKNYMKECHSIEEAIKTYIKEVKSSHYPDEQYSFS